MSLSRRGPFLMVRACALMGLEPGHWLRQPLSGRFSFWEPQRNDWPRLFDGVFFIDAMTPSTPAAGEHAN
jgi:hypothetical protein